MPVRIYDLAKKLGIENKQVLTKAKDLGISAAKVPSSSLDKITAQFLEDELVKVYPQPNAAPPPAPAAPPPPPAPITIISKPVEEPESEPAVEEEAYAVDSPLVEATASPVETVTE